uniref:Uncharacterized protein n=1 Tax=Klebsiella pneumoniae TaxID=573 RepID=A0A8B0SUW2_KLEPN|nr:hypothetical protein [Klebsiella pneumoniae]
MMVITKKINFTELTTLAHSVDISLISDVKNVTNTGGCRVQ